MHVLFRPLREIDNGGLITMVRDWVESVGLDSDPSSPYERQSAEMLAVLEELESRPSVQAIRNEVV